MIFFAFLQCYTKESTKAVYTVEATLLSLNSDLTLKPPTPQARSYNILANLYKNKTEAKSYSIYLFLVVWLGFVFESTTTL